MNTATSGEEIAFANVDDDSIFEIMIHPQADLIAFGTRFGNLGIWDISAENDLSQIVIATFERNVDTVLFTPDGRFLVAQAGTRLSIFGVPID